jgi:endonuclease V-like protein UPF0215 family
VGVDDGPFERGDRFAPVVAIVFSAPNYVEGILRTRVTVDGTDATHRIASLLLRSPFLEGARALLLDGIAVGGFNLVDLDRLHAAIRRPVVTVTRRPPEFEAIRKALRTYFPKDFRERWKLVSAHRLFRIPTGAQPLLASVVGATRRDAVALVRRTTVRGFLPEPLRLARLVARALAPRPAPPRA